MADVYISGVGMTRFGKHEGSLHDMIGEAVKKATEECGIDDFDAIYVGVMSPEEFLGQGNIAASIVDYLGFSGTPSFRIETASSTGAAVFQAAFYAVASGYIKRALVLAGEKMTHLPTPTTTGILAEVIEQKERSAGATMPALAAMITQKYMSTYEIPLSTMEQYLSKVALKNHYNGSLNKFAQFQEAISEETYFKSRIIAAPLRLYDCSPISDGAVALILTSDKTDIKVSGIGHGTDTLGVRFRNSFTTFKSTQIAAKKAYQMAKLNPHDIDIAELHDAFTPFEIIDMEDVGFYPPGKGVYAIENGETNIGGKLPVNTSGGLKSRGHPVGASGLAQIIDLAWQLRGQVNEKRLTQNASVGLAQSIGGLANNNFVTIIERSDRNRVIAPNWQPTFNPEIALKAPHQKDPESITPMGTVETFTVLYIAPKEFETPFQIGFVRDDNGHVLIAKSKEVKDLKVGDRVNLSQEDGKVFIE
ncbi:MAG: thiolase family protein [Candidatus Tectomicrobia bacterium]|nr:thiolase family protein [Candidatus Tectomicrobia bacterium]